jgi:hypothetical protein
MRRAIGQSVASNRSCAVVAKSGRTRVCFIETAGLTTVYSGSAKNVRVNTPASVTSGLVKLGEGTSDMKSVTELLMGSSRSIAASVKDGNARMSFTKLVRKKTD